MILNLNSFCNYPIKMKSKLTFRRIDYHPPKKSKSPIKQFHTKRSSTKWNVRRTKIFSGRLKRTSNTRERNGGWYPTPKAEANLEQKEGKILQTKEEKKKEGKKKKKNRKRKAVMTQSMKAFLELRLRWLKVKAGENRLKAITVRP